MTHTTLSTQQAPALGFDRAQAEEYLDVIYQGANVRVALPYKLPHAALNDTTTFELPAQRELLLDRAESLTARGADVYITPGSIRPDGRRQQSDMQWAYSAWIDLDDKLAHSPDHIAFTLEQIRREGGYLVRSSEHGHHAYFALNAPVAGEDSRRINRLLQRKYAEGGADPASVDASRFLRLPGTYNHKYDTPQPCTSLGWSGELADTADLLRNAPAPDAERVEAATGEPVEYDGLPQQVRDRLVLADEATNLSDYFAGCVWECRDAGLSLAQTTYVMETYGPDIERYRTRSAGIAGEVARVWGKEGDYGVESTKAGDEAPAIDLEQEKFEAEVRKEERRLKAQAEAKKRIEAARTATKPKVSDLILDWDALMEQPLPEFLVEDILVEGGIGLVAGESGLGKSFVVLDLLLSVTTGEPFLGQHATKKTKTLYVVAEGSYDAKLRVLAWAREHHLPRVDGFAIYPEPVNLLNEADVQRLADFSTEHGFGLVCLDTMSQCTPGVNENDNGAMAAALRAASLIGTTTLVVHHTGKSEAAGMRGASSIYGNADMVMRQKRAKRLVNGKEELLPQTFFELYLEKCKGAKDHYTLGQFERATVCLGDDPRKDDGSQLSSCVVRPRTVIKVPEFGNQNSKTERIAAQMRETDFLAPDGAGKATIKKAWDKFIEAPKFAEMDLESAADKTLEMAYTMYRKAAEEEAQDE